MKRSLAKLCRTRSAQPLLTSFEWHKGVISFAFGAQPELDAADNAELDQHLSSSYPLKSRAKSPRRERAGSRSKK
jgi:hypothetical protein